MSTNLNVDFIYYATVLGSVQAQYNDRFIITTYETQLLLLGVTTSLNILGTFSVRGEGVRRNLHHRQKQMLGEPLSTR